MKLRNWALDDECVRAVGRQLTWSVARALHTAEPPRKTDIACTGRHNEQVLLCHGGRGNAYGWYV